MKSGVRINQVLTTRWASDDVRALLFGLSADKGQEVIQNGYMQLEWPRFVLFAAIQSNEIGGQ